MNGLNVAYRDAVVPGVSTVVSMRCRLTPPALAALPVPNTVLPQRAQLELVEDVQDLRLREELHPRRSAEPVACS